MERCKVISFINLKGGVGKTSSAINIADELSKESNVLVIDMDPQFNATQSLLNYQLSNAKDCIPKDILVSVEEAFKKDYEGSSDENNAAFISGTSEIKFNVKSQLIYQELKNKKITVNSLFIKDSIVDGLLYPDLIYRIKDNLSLVPGNLDLFTSLNGDTAGKHNVLEDYFIKHELRDKFDYIIIDCPPNWTILTQASLFASDYYIIPSKVDLFSSIGIGLLQNLVDKTYYDSNSNLYTTYNMFRNKASREPLKALGVLFTLTNELKISSTIKNKLKEQISELNFLNSEIPYHSSVPLKFSLYSEAGEKHISLTNSLEKIVTEIQDIITEDMARNEEN